VPTVTIRDVTERPETIECGSNVLAGVQPELMLNSVKAVLKQKPNWQPPAEYLVEDVSTTVLKIVLGYTHKEIHGL
jgi:UDP-N-acetylglucosamine 2-epimerase (non-hydrolysing)